MLVYSAAIHPGQQAAFYNAQARVLLPYVAVTVSLPLFYWLARSADSRMNALALWLHGALDLAICSKRRRPRRLHNSMAVFASP